MHMLRIAVTALAASAQALHRPRGSRGHRELIDRAAAQGIKISTHTDDALCLGVADHKACDHQAVVLQPCDDAKTARWRFKDGALKTGKNMCLDVPDGRNVNGQPLQVYTCFAGNTNQKWVSRDNHLVWRGSNKSLDVTDGCFDEEAPLQLWDTFAENINQAFALEGLGAPSAVSSASASALSTSATQTLIVETASTTSKVNKPAPAPTTPAANGAATAAGSFSGYGYISFDAFMALHPVLNPLRQDILDAAASANIGLPPILLAAQALQESSGNPFVGNGGLGQFKWETWQQFGRGDINNGRDNLFAMANYLKYLLGVSQGNLDEALRIYSGSLSFYQGDIRRWLMGDFVYGPGT